MEIVGAIIAAMVAGIFSLYTNEQTNKQSQKNQEAQNQWNEEQAQTAREWDKPEEQMERLLAAGINPAAAADSITGSSPIGSPVAQSGQGAPVYNPDLSFADFTKQFKEIAEATKTNKDKKWVDRLNDKQIEKANKEIEDISSKIGLQGSQKAWFETQSRELVTMNQAKRDEIQAKITNYQALNEYYASNVLHNIKLNEKIDQDIAESEARIENINADTNLKNISGENIQKEYDLKASLNEAQVIQLLSEAGLNDIAAKLKSHEIDLTDAKTQKEVWESIIKQQESGLAKMGLFVGNDWKTNLMTMAGTGIKVYGDYNIKTINKIYSGFIDVCKSIKTGITNKYDNIKEYYKKNRTWNTNPEYKKYNVGKNIYGNSWDSGRPVYNPSVRY